MRPLLIFPLLALASCATGPTVILRSDGSRVINLGASLFEDSKAELAMVKLPDGTEISYRKDGKMQSKVPLSGIRTWGTVAGMAIVNEAMVATTAIPYSNATKQEAIKAGVEKAKIQADVTKATFVSHEIAP